MSYGIVNTTLCGCRSLRRNAHQKMHMVRLNIEFYNLAAQLLTKHHHTFVDLLCPPDAVGIRIDGRPLQHTEPIRPFHFLKKKPYWGNHFWAKGYCIDSVGLNSEMIQRYVRFQEKEEHDQQQLQLEPGP